MPKFFYRVKSSAGQFKDGTIQAENKIAVIKKLRQDGLYPLSIEEVSEISLKKQHKKISSRNISDFTRQLANLMHSGFSLNSALSVLSQQEQNPGLKKMISDLHEKIQKGFTFSQVLEEYPDTFSSFYVNMVKIGETGGRLDESLLRLADFKERENELVSQVKSASVYPAFLFSLGVLSVFVVITFLVPRFASLFASFGQALPIPTQIIVKLSNFMSRSWWFILAGIIALYLFLARYLRKEKNRLLADRLLLRLPLVKDLIEKIEMARLTYALGVLLKSGIPVLEALSVVGASVNNRVFKKSVSGFRDKISKGQSLSSCLQSEKIFPVILTNTVRVGEESGELADMLLKSASIFDSEANRTIKTFVSLIEPILVISIGCVIILIILSIILPIFQMNLLIQ